MRIEGQWVPESDEELELFSDLHEAKVKAYDNGLDPDQISAAFSYIASASLVEKPEEETQSLEDRMEEEKEKRDDCPKCGQEIQDAEVMGIGGEFVLHPCGHEFNIEEDLEDIGPWIEIPDDNDEW